VWVTGCARRRPERELLGGAGHPLEGAADLRGDGREAEDEGRAVVLLREPREGAGESVTWPLDDVGVSLVGVPLDPSEHTFLPSPGRGMGAGGWGILGDQPMNKGMSLDVEHVSNDEQRRQCNAVLGL